MDLYTLAKNILVINSKGISKVRFAKTIYFAYKDMVSNDLCDIDDIQFIRMPLGPVPEGFMTLAVEHPDIMTRYESSEGLPYNSRIYFVDTDPHTNIPDDIENSLRITLERVGRLKTSELVEISHKDPSWIAHVNGEHYSIVPNDLKDKLPNKQLLARLDSDDHLLQASLVKGMLDDIVKESTDLEYPDNA